jgi:hypothetical protein
MMNTPRLAAQFLVVAIRDTARLAARCFIRFQKIMCLLWLKKSRRASMGDGKTAG